MINRETNEIRKEFIKVFKHPYISEDFYNSVLSEKQIFYFQDLLKESGQPEHIDLFYALLHMQLSLDIHDLIELKFNSSSEEKRNQTNQLQVLVGDFHSSYFYRILSEQNYLDELYHFIKYIKEINELKMTLLHSEASDLNSQLDQIESVHCGLFNSVIDLYGLTEYKNKKISELVTSLVYQSQSVWLDLLKSKEPSTELMINERINRLNKMSYTGES
ncbi:heptaprenyl diphosphate synthase component 1 [Piscibacillus sp. B03]|uniref:heptaprenyl diphosphate synthase component 1 n=1 Tax=Piscibacillus sp. B03 TaxID=3457430 RepID=UPI003FCEC5BC